MSGHHHRSEHAGGQVQEHGVSLAAPVERPNDPAHESLAGALHSSFRVLRLIMVGLVVAYVWSGLFRVNPGEQGLIARWGALRSGAKGAVFPPGWHLAMPDPLDEKIRLPGQVQEVVFETFTFKPLDADIGKPLSQRSSTSDSLKPGVDGAMVTGDKNLSHGVWRVLFQIREGDRYVTNVGETPAAAHRLLSHVLENAVVRVVSSLRVEEVTRTPADVALRVKERMQAELDRLETGIFLSEIRGETIEPAQVRDAFNRVTVAQNEKQTAIQGAEQKRKEILNKAAGPNHVKLMELIEAYGAATAVNAERERLEGLRRQIDAELDRAGGSVAALLNEARAEAGRARESVKREFEEFTYLLALYRQDPQLTVNNLWEGMRERVLSSRANETFFLPHTKEIEIITNRDPKRQKAIDIEAYRKAAGLPTGESSGGLPK